MMIREMDTVCPLADLLSSSDLQVILHKKSGHMHIIQAEYSPSGSIFATECIRMCHRRPRSVLLEPC